MKILQELQSKYHALIFDKLNINALSFISEEVPYPIIKFGNVHITKWLISPVSYIVNMELEICSDKTSNVEVFQIMNNLEECLRNCRPNLERFKMVRVDIDDSKIIPFDDQLTMGLLSIKIYIRQND